jgi:hypothetical protein
MTIRMGSIRRNRVTRTVFFFVVVSILLLFAHQLPAPISEETAPTPKPQPKREATPKPKPAATPKPKPTPSRSFAGTWTGSVIATASNGESGSSDYIIKISDDEKTVLISCVTAGQTPTGPPTQVSCTRFREALSWSISGSEDTNIYTMRINPSGTASLIREGKWISGDNEGITYNHTGTLSRQDVSTTTLLPQTTAISPTPQTTTTVPPQIGEIPTARPVPDRPGFVYNPFDRTAKRLLDVRGKASGSKVKDPFSGRLFIVP